MCRWIAYLGDKIFLDELVTKPSHSLVEQSIDAEMHFKTDGSLWAMNGDGFGIGWYNIPYDDDDLVEKVSAKTTSKDTEIIVYCASLDCKASEKVAGQLEEVGYTNVKDFAGGLEEWKNAGYDLEGQQQAA